MAPKKTTTKTEKAPKGEVATKTPRVAKASTATPEQIYAYCVEQAEKLGGVPKATTAEHFGITPNALIMTLMEHCARHGVVPPPFQQKGSSTPGTIKVRKQGKQGSPVLSVGPSYLRGVGIESAENGAVFGVELDTEGRRIILTFLEETGEAAGDEDDDEG